MALRCLQRRHASSDFALFDPLACLRRAPFLFRQERGERTGQGRAVRWTARFFRHLRSCASEMTTLSKGRFRISPPSLKRPKGVIPLLENPEIPPAPAIRTKCDPGVRITHRICKLRADRCLPLRRSPVSFCLFPVPFCPDQPVWEALQSFLTI